MIDPKVYDDTYFLTGQANKKSGYTNYRYLPELSGKMCRRIVDVLGIDRDDTICDYGCARGYIVRAFRELGYKAYGFDVSVWAINNCDPTVANYVRLIEGGSFSRLTKKFDFVLAKDVLEHIPDEELPKTIDALCDHARKGVFVVVPLSAADGQPYVVPEYEADITHTQRLSLGSWVKRLQRPGFCVSACYLIPGIKDNYREHVEGNGFLTIRREVQL